MCSVGCLALFGTGLKSSSMKIYVCGNPLVDADSLPLRLLPRLRKMFAADFFEFDPSEDLPKEPTLIFIDTVINAKDVLLLDDVDRFVETKALSLHDFDLGLNLKLAKKMGWLKKAYIIGIPPNISENSALEKIGKIIASLS